MRKALLLFVCAIYLASPISAQLQSQDWKHSITAARELYDDAKFSAAIIEAERALTLAEESFGKSDVRVAETLELLALLNSLAEKPNAVVPLYVRAVKVRRISTGGKSALAETLFQLAGTYRVNGRSKSALSAYLEAIALNEPLEASDSEYLFDRLRDLARTYRDIKRFSDAEKVYLRYVSLEKLKNVGGLYLSYEEVALFYQERRRYAKAEEYYSLALAALKEKLSENDPNVALMMRREAELYTEEKKYDQANKILDEALVILGIQSRQSAVSFANIYADKAKIYKRKKDRARAMEYLDKANSMLLKERTVFIEAYRYEDLEE